MSTNEVWRPVSLAAHWSPSNHGYLMVITETVTDKRLTLEQIVARYNILTAEKLTAAFETGAKVDAEADKAAHPERWPLDSSS